jgi:hypothetical protein
LDGKPKFRTSPSDKVGCDFGYEEIAASSLNDLVSAAKLPPDASPKVLEFQG